jgi:predicted methyltransferase
MEEILADTNVLKKSFAGIYNKLSIIPSSRSHTKRGFWDVYQRSIEHGDILITLVDSVFSYTELGYNHSDVRTYEIIIWKNNKSPNYCRIIMKDHISVRLVKKTSEEFSLSDYAYDYWKDEDPEKYSMADLMKLI